MKKFLFTLAVTIIVIFLLLSYSWDKENIRSDIVTIYSISDNYVTIEEKGQFFKCYVDSTKNLERGQVLKAFFLTNNTENTNNDSFVNFRIIRR